MKHGLDKLHGSHILFLQLLVSCCILQLDMRGLLLGRSLCVLVCYCVLWLGCLLQIWTSIVKGFSRQGEVQAASYCAFIIITHTRGGMICMMGRGRVINLQGQNMGQPQHNGPPCLLVQCAAGCVVCVDRVVWSLQTKKKKKWAKYGPAST